MPYASNTGIRIHYEVEGEGPPLVLVHGFLGSLKAWHARGYVEELKSEYRLILIDACGHGSSDKPHNADAYTSKLRAGDIVAVLDKLNLSQAHYFGHSMGGWIGFAIAKHAPKRIQSLITGGAHPYKRDPEPLNDRAEILGKGMEAYIASMQEQNSRPMDPVIKKRLLANDAEALVASALAIRDDPGFQDALSTLTMPCLLYVGEADPRYPLVKEAAKQIPKVTFVSFPDLTHVEANSRSDMVLPYVTKFSENIIRDKDALA